MRRLCLILLCSLLVVPAALAGTRTSGDGVLELKAAAGVMVVNGSRGTLWGQMDSGKVIVTDPFLGDGTILVSGAEAIRPGATDNVVVYSGRDLHFRVTGGKYKLRFVGSGVDLTAVGVGTAQLAGDVFADDPGDYALDSGKWNPIPVFFSKTIRFGAPPVTTP